MVTLERLGSHGDAALQEKLAATVTDSEGSGGGGEGHGVVRTLVTEYTATVPAVMLWGDRLVDRITCNGLDSIIESIRDNISYPRKGRNAHYQMQVTN